MNEPLADRVENQIGAGMQVQLLQNVPPVRFDGVQAQSSCAAISLLVYPRRSIEDLAFTRSQ